MGFLCLLLLASVATGIFADTSACNETSACHRHAFANRLTRASDYAQYTHVITTRMLGNALLCF